MKLDSQWASWNLTHKSSSHLQKVGVGVGTGQCELAWLEGEERCSASLSDSLGQWPLHTPGISVKTDQTCPCLALMCLVLSGQPENPARKADSSIGASWDGVGALDWEHRGPWQGHLREAAQHSGEKRARPRGRVVQSCKGRG